MAEYIINLSALKQQPNPTKFTLRNVAIRQGDEFELVVTVYADEDASAPLDITGSNGRLYLYRERDGCHRWDYGFGWLTYGWQFDRRPIEVIYGHTVGDSGSVPVTDPGALLPAIPPTIGQIVFCFPQSATAHLTGRFGFEVILQTHNASGASILRGIFEIERGFVTSSHSGFVLGESALAGPDVLGPPIP
jgi:hypothetical protein